MIPPPPRSTLLPYTTLFRSRLVTATRRTFGAGLSDLKRYVSYGASPRASIALVTGARALAFLYGRDYVLPDDVRELADRKSTRLNSSHSQISYAVFCLKKQN